MLKLILNLAKFLNGIPIEYSQRYYILLRQFKE